VRTLIVTGPGGAGTSTLAAAAAVRAARSGRRTLLLSRRPVAVAGLDAEPHLEVAVVDARASLEQLWSGSAAAVAEVLPQLTLPPSGSVVPLPGTGDVALLAALGRADADLVVLDAGPVDDAALALERAGMTLDQIDLIEFNEAFAAQVLAVVRELRMPPEKVNVNGGAIALGHPLGATGSKLTTQLIHELRRRGGGFGLVTMCVGGGMGAAGIFEVYGA
jgi:acetyl-CoA acetyltransferase